MLPRPLGKLGEMLRHSWRLTLVSQASLLSSTAALQMQQSTAEKLLPAAWGKPPLHFVLLRKHHVACQVHNVSYGRTGDLNRCVFLRRSQNSEINGKKSKTEPKQVDRKSLAAQQVLQLHPQSFWHFLPE